MTFATPARPARASYAERVRKALRDDLLDAAYAELVERGYRGLRMQDVATAAGVSRQTVYNEFGDKWGLAQALALRETERFLDGIDQALASHEDTYPAVRSAVTFTLRAAESNPLLRTMLTGGDADELLPLLTSRGEPVLVAARTRISRDLRSRRSGFDERDAFLVADAITRLTVSHLVLPLDPPEVVADGLARLVAAGLGRPAPARPPIDRGGDRKVAGAVTRLPSRRTRPRTST